MSVSVEQLAAQIRAGFKHPDSRGRLNYVDGCRACSAHVALDSLVAYTTQLETAIRRVRNDIGLTVYEGTPVSVWSGKNIVRIIDEALTAGGVGDTSQ